MLAPCQRRTDLVGGDRAAFPSVADHPGLGALCQRRGGWIIDVQHRDGVCFETLEQHCLGVEVLPHVGVEVEVVVAEVGEDGGREAHPVDPSQGQRVRRNFDRCGPAVGVDHAA